MFLFECKSLTVFARVATNPVPSMYRLPNRRSNMPRFLTIVAGILTLLIGLSVSLVVFAFIALFGSVAFAYYWWKTREIRRLMKAHIEQRMRQQQQGPENGEGIVIEGEWQSDAHGTTNESATLALENQPSVASAHSPAKDSEPRP